MFEVITFDQALKETESCPKRLLLLGNGFSIECFPNIFSYDTLYGQADFTKTPELPKVFDELKTNDFEQVIKALDGIVKVAHIYGGTDPAMIEKMRMDSIELKNILVKTIAKRHPELPSKISDSQMQACRKFLGNFIGDKSKGKVYTLNYDLLLYWVIMHEEATRSSTQHLLRKNDGFGRDEETYETDYVIWHGEGLDSKKQSIYYLHGALHLFDAGNQLQKYTWINTKVPLINQTRFALNDEKYPMFVSEGTKEQKLAKIQHSAYLHHAYKSFTAEVSSQKNCMFIHGHSLSDNDGHIFQKIIRNRIPRLYVSVNTTAGQPVRPAKIEAVNKMIEARGVKHPLNVKFYDTSTAKVWV